MLLPSRLSGGSGWKSIPELPDKPSRFILAEMHAQRVRARYLDARFGDGGIQQFGRRDPVRRALIEERVLVDVIKIEFDVEIELLAIQLGPQKLPIRIIGLVEHPQLMQIVH